MEAVNEELQRQNCTVTEVHDMQLAWKVTQSFCPTAVTPTRGTTLGCEVGDGKAASHKQIASIGCAWPTTGGGQWPFLQHTGKTRWNPRTNAALQNSQLCTGLPTHVLHGWSLMHEMCLLVVQWGSVHCVHTQHPGVQGNCPWWQCQHVQSQDHITESTK